MIECLLGLEAMTPSIFYQQQLQTVKDVNYLDMVHSSDKATGHTTKKQPGNPRVIREEKN